jgi:hypothetical protein
MDNEQGFTRLILMKAACNTANLIRSRSSGFVFLIASAATGSLLYWWLHGFPEDSGEAFRFALFVVATFLVFIIIAFAWFFVIAPNELTYEAVRAALEEAAQASEEMNPINWEVWRRRSRYTPAELACILAEREPSAAVLPQPAEQLAYKQLIWEEINEGKLACEGSLPAGPKIEKATAISWAEAQGFDVSHIK